MVLWFNITFHIPNNHSSSTILNPILHFLLSSSLPTLPTTSKPMNHLFLHLILFYLPSSSIPPFPSLSLPPSPSQSLHSLSTLPLQMHKSLML